MKTGGTRMQVIVIESAEALAEQIHQEWVNNPLANVKMAVLNCLHPIEVPSDALELAKAVEAAIVPQYNESPNGRGGIMVISKDYSKAAALITAHSRTVPRAMLEEVGDYCYERGKEHRFLLDPAKIDEITENFGYHAE